MLKIEGTFKSKTRHWKLYGLLETKKGWRKYLRQSWRKRRFWWSWEYNFQKYGRYDENIRLDLAGSRIRVRLREAINGR